MNKLHVARTNAADKLGVSARLDVVRVFFAAHQIMRIVELESRAPQGASVATRNDALDRAGWPERARAQGPESGSLDGTDGAAANVRGSSSLP
jgi:hypothetical protein